MSLCSGARDDDIAGALGSSCMVWREQKEEPGRHSCLRQEVLSSVAQAAGRQRESAL